jgi:S1-C subfamily serine protease
MAQLAMRSMATVSLTIDEIEAMAETAGPEAGELEALLDGVKAMPAADIRKVLKLSQSVGKVCAPNGRAVGTGFLLHGRHVHPALANEYVFLTNDHVVCDEKSYEGASIRSAEACIVFEDLNPDEIYQVSEIFWRSDSHTHDCAILRLHKQPEGLLGELEIQDSLPLRHSTQAGQADKDAPLRAPRVFVVGHPNGRGLEITFEHNYIIDHELKNPAAKATPQPVRIHYRAPTEPGNSGSPVLSTSSLKLIGIHHSTTDEPLGRMRKRTSPGPSRSARQ